MLGVHHARMSKVSFVVITENDESGIARRLWSLRHQQFADGSAHEIQIVVVDNHSTDRTLMLSVPCVDGVAVAGPDAEAQWDLGRRIVSGDVVVRIDRGTEITPWIAAEAADAAHRERFAQLV